MKGSIVGLIVLGTAARLLAQTPAAPGVSGQPGRPGTPAVPAATAPQPSPAPHTPAPARPAAPTLSIADPAPALGINVWIKGTPVNEFEGQRIYVVEFWSRNVPACRRSGPLLSELQTIYKPKGVTIISVALMEPDGPGNVDAFVKQSGGKLSHTIGYDNTGDTTRRYLQPTGQSGIPVAFVVDGQGRLAWIGHPLDGLDRVLQSMTDGTWNILKAHEEAARRAAADAKSQPLISQLEEQFAASEVDKALATMDELAAIDPPLTGEWAMSKFAYLLMQRRDADKAYAYAAAASEGVLKDDAETLKAIAWMTLAEPGVVRRDVVLARQLAQRADDLTKHADANVLDTLAKAKFDSGDLAGAVETQKRAVEATILPSQRKELELRLRQYMAAKKAEPPARPG
jgi:hypothetical protein